MTAYQYLCTCELSTYNVSKASDLDPTLALPSRAATEAAFFHRQQERGERSKLENRLGSLAMRKGRRRRMASLMAVL